MGEHFERNKYLKKLPSMQRVMDNDPYVSAMLKYVTQQNCKLLIILISGLQIGSIFLLCLFLHQIQYLNTC